MALSELAAPPFHDTMKMHLSSSAFHQDDMWTTCGGYAGENGLLNSDDELTNMVSMVSSLQDTHRNRQEVFPSGLHRNASFDSGSTSHDSCTASFSTGSPVTVLPPLPHSSCGEGKEEDSSYMQYVNSGLWAAHDQASSDCGQILHSPGGENFSSLLLNELPLRSYDDDVHHIGCNKDYLECVVPASISSHPSYQTSDNSGSTLESTLTGIKNSSSFCTKTLVGHEHDSSEHNSNYSSNPPRVSSATTVHGESDLSPTGQHRRLSWTDHHWPVNSTSRLLHVPLNNFQSATGAQSLPLPQQIIHGFKSSNMTQNAALNFHDADYVATCSQYRKTELRESNNSGGTAATNTLKRSYEAMQSTAVSNNSSSSQAVPAVLSLDKLASASNQQQEAAALSALLYKNNHGSDLIQKLRAGPSCIAGGSVQGATSGDSTILQPPPKMRRRHGTATDPQSIAARTRRERFSDRIKLLQCLVPNGERLDTVSMLGHTLEYVRFLQHQVWQLYNGSDDASIPQPDSESREKWKEFMDTTQTGALALAGVHHRHQLVFALLRSGGLLELSPLFKGRLESELLCGAMVDHAKCLTIPHPASLGVQQAQRQSKRNHSHPNEVASLRARCLIDCKSVQSWSARPTRNSLVSDGSHLIS